MAIRDDIFRRTKMDLNNVLEISVVRDYYQYCTPGVFQQVTIKPKPGLQHRIFTGKLAIPGRRLG